MIESDTCKFVVLLKKNDNLHRLSFYTGLTGELLSHDFTLHDSEVTRETTDIRIYAGL